MLIIVNGSKLYVIHIGQNIYLYILSRGGWLY